MPARGPCLPSRARTWRPWATARRRWLTTRCSAWAWCRSSRRGYAERLGPAGTRTLPMARDTAALFAWFCPEDDGVQDPRLAAAAAAADDPGADDRLAAAGVGRVVVRAADRGRVRGALTRLL